MAETATLHENRETFFARLRPLLAPSAFLKVELAYILAKYFHRAQVRKEKDPTTGKPIRYFEHTRRAALILIDEGMCVDWELICAALLHDSREDTELTAAMIEHCFSAEVARIVNTLSKIPKEGYHERLALYGDWKVILVKLCDRLDNLRTLEATSVEFQRKQVAETKKEYLPLADMLTTMAPKPYHMAAHFIRKLIHKRVREIEKKLA